MPRLSSNGSSDGSRWVQRARYIAVALVTGLALIIAACGTTTKVGPGGSTTPTSSPGASGTTVKVYFTRHPDSDNLPTKVFALSRTSTATLTTTQAKATYALERMLAGPSQSERAQSYYSPFDGQLALQSVCPGEFRDFDLTLDHRGPTAEKGTATFQFCRRVDIPGDLDGPRMSAMVTSTLLQFSDIKKVVILNYQGNCFDDLQGANACLAGSTTPAPTGYPVNVFFSRHPDSENDFTKVFSVRRTAPNLGVATYAVQQLIAGPAAAEQQAGYYTELTGAIDKSDASSCSGADFTITLNTRGTIPEDGVATLRFCRTLHTGGIGADARINAELQATLTQFSNIKKAVILTKAGDCFGDMSTQNSCLKP
jgi:hypothetical protein